MLHESFPFIVCCVSLERSSQTFNPPTMDAANQFGRGTPAGNAIYRLYNKKSMDSTLDPELLARLQKMRKEREAAEAEVTQVKATPKSQTHVNVPKFGRRGQAVTDEQRATARLNAMGHRKREGDIKEEVKNSEPVSIPAPSKPAITDKDKDKLAQIFQFGEVLPPVTQYTGANAARLRRPTEEERLEGRFEELSELLAEKKAYLAEIRQGVAGGKNAADRRQAEMICTNDIAQMIQEMKSIDASLRTIGNGGGSGAVSAR